MKDQVLVSLQPMWETQKELLGPEFDQLSFGLFNHSCNDSVDGKFSLFLSSQQFYLSNKNKIVKLFMSIFNCIQSTRKSQLPFCF